MENAIVRVPSLARDGGREAHQRPGGVHAGRRVHPRPVRRSRVLGRCRVLRARPRRRRRHGQARRRVDRRGHALARRLAHGLAPLRRRLPQPGVHARAHEGDLRDLLRRQVPGPRALRGPAAPRVAGVRAAAGARRGVRREVRLGAGELVRAERGERETSRFAHAAGPESSGRRRSGPSTPRAARPRRSSTRARSRRSSSQERARPSCSSASAPTASRARSGG